MGKHSMPASDPSIALRCALLIAIGLAVAVGFGDSAHASCIIGVAPPESPIAPADPICGAGTCNNCVGSPCFLQTGNYQTDATDLAIKAVGLPLLFGRHYESALTVDGPLGRGWSFSYDAQLHYVAYLSQGSATYVRQAAVTMPDGSRLQFTQQSDGSFTPPPGRFDQLLANGDGTFDLTVQRSRTVLHFATDGPLASINDGFGNLTILAYDTSGRLTTVTDSGSGRAVAVYYGGDGRISTLQDSAARQVLFVYNADGTLASVTDPANRQTTYAYVTGRFGPLLSATVDNWGRHTTDITYNGDDTVASYSTDGDTYTLTYAGGWGNYAIYRTTETDGLNHVVSSTYATNGLIADRTYPDGSVLHRDYDGNGLVWQTIDPVGIKTATTFDQFGRTTAITRDYQGPGAIRFDYTYDPAFPTAVTAVTPRNPATNQLNLNWQAWQYDYYQQGDPAPGAVHHVYRLENDGSTRDLLATYAYDSQGRLISNTSPVGGVTDYAYDGQGNLHTITAPPNNDGEQRPITTYGYDALGRVTSVTDPLGHAKTYTYDAIDRILTVTLPKPAAISPLVFTTTYTYDAYDPDSGLTVTSITDPNAIIIQQGYDQFGRLAQSMDGLGNATMYAYAHGLLVSITDANGNVTSYSYDVLRRLAATHFPEGDSETYSYYADGQLHTKTDRNAQTVTYAYDHFKRLSTKSYPNSTAIAYTYAGQLLMQIYDTSTSPAETHSFQYDSSYRVETNVQGPRGTLTYQYNPDDTVLSFSVQGGPTTSYTYYASGALDTVAWTPVSGFFKYTYTLNGQYQTITMPNGQSRNYAYDDQGRLLQLANLHPSAGNLATYGYSYDLNNATGQYTRLGQRVSMTADVPSQGFTGAVTAYNYDQDYQLIQASYPNAAPFRGEIDSWQYDAIGNRTTANGQAYTYLKNGGNPTNGQRLSSDGQNTYTYDANGATLTKSGSSNYTFGWDLENRLTSISGSVTASYAYDYQRRRTNKTVSAAAISYLYNGVNLVQEVGSADYVLGPGIDGPLAVAKNGTVFYLDADAAGSIVATNDNSGAIQHAAVFDAWGSTKSEVGARIQPFTYTGREVGDAGDPFYRARYYNPEIGRFDSEDPLPVAKGQFAYVGNAPTTYIDPLGLVEIQWDTSMLDVRHPTCGLASPFACNDAKVEDLQCHCHCVGSVVMADPVVLTVSATIQILSAPWWPQMLASHNLKDPSVTGYYSGVAHEYRVHLEPAASAAAGVAAQLDNRTWGSVDECIADCARVKVRAIQKFDEVLTLTLGSDQ
jgi:RHS repeat-associated protein